jgi:phage shock protein A
MKREVENVRANEALLRAQSAIAHNQAGVNSRLGTAMDSLGRIKKRQEETANRIAAGAELAAIEDGTDLDRQLREAGIGGATQSADDILAQLMAPAPEQATLPPPNKRLT